jgi:AraC-like DNA-binding protein
VPTASQARGSGRAPFTRSGRVPSPAYTTGPSTSDSYFPRLDPTFLERLRQLDDVAAIDALAKLIQARHPRPDPRIALVNAIIDSIDGDESIQTVREVARRFGWTERWIQQLFQEYVGVGLKWQLQRNKLLAAARRIRLTDRPNWSALAYELGYSSQQHFITEFQARRRQDTGAVQDGLQRRDAAITAVKRSAAPARHTDTDLRSRQSAASILHTRLTRCPQAGALSRCRASPSTGRAWANAPRARNAPRQDGRGGQRVSR